MQTMKAFSLIATAMCLSSPLLAQAAKDEAAAARGGVLRCGGNSYLRMSGTEIQSTSYTMRNFNERTGITLDRIRAFDATGLQVFDSAVSGIPLSANGVVGPSNNVIPPNATVDINSAQMVGFLSEARRPIQVEVQWSAPASVLALNIVANRHVRGRNPATGETLEERSRHAIECLNTVLN